MKLATTDTITTLLEAGSTAADVAEELGLDYDEKTESVLLPGWLADDGTAEVDYPDAETGEEAAEEYAADGDWGALEETTWIRVRVWRVGYRYDDAGGVEEVVAQEDVERVELAPREPDCEPGEAHDWQSPHALVGGMRENPGVWGHGGGVIIREVCVKCGCGRTTDTWAQDKETGEQGLTSVSYDPGEYLDEVEDARADYDV